VDSWVAFDFTYAVASLVAVCSLRKSNAFSVYLASCVIVPCVAAGLMVMGAGESAEEAVSFFMLVGFGYAVPCVMAARKQLRPLLVYKLGAMSLLAGVTGIQYGLYGIGLVDTVVFYNIYSSAMAALMLLNGWELGKDWIAEHGSRYSDDYGANADSWKRSHRAK